MGKRTKSRRYTVAQQDRADEARAARERDEELRRIILSEANERYIQPDLRDAVLGWPAIQSPRTQPAGQPRPVADLLAGRGELFRTP